MFHIIQSNDINQLFNELLIDYQKKSNQIFEPFIVIVPSKVMGDWLKKQVADQTGVSTLVTAEFWGRYQWTLMQQVLQTFAKYRPQEALRVPEVAVLSKNVMQWRLYGYFNAQKHQILNDPNHVLYPLLEPLIGVSHIAQAPFINVSQANQAIASMRFSPIAKGYHDIPKWLRKTSFTDKSQQSASDHLGANASLMTFSQGFQTASDDQRLWQLANDMASMLSRYMTYRPEWLNLWAEGLHVNVRQMIAKKDAFSLRMAGIDLESYQDNPTKSASPVTPEWLTEHYEQLEKAQSYLWQNLFSETYQYRQKIEAQFWQALGHQDKKIATACQNTLPDQLTLFTIQQLPQTELNIMAKLAHYTNIKLLHYNPSEMFWADIVDKNWLAQQTYINPEAIYFKDYGHTLLSRFGKQSREVFAMLADFSGNDSEKLGEVLWEDKFVPVIATDALSDSTHPPTLLAQLQQDILMLQEQDTQYASQQVVDDLLQQIQERRYQHKRAWQFSHIDNSLSIHACHSMVRQLEVLRAMIIGWLNYVDKPYLLEGLTPSVSAPQKSVKRPAKKSKNTAQLSLFDALPDEVMTTVIVDTFDNHDNAKQLNNHTPTHHLTRANRRALSDILVLVPDIEAQQNVIESIFPKGVGTDGYELPAKVTGVTSKDINQLWSAITGFFTLLQSTHTTTSATNTATTGQASGQSVARFDRARVFDWLMLPPLIESYGLSQEQMSRGCELLAMAGFVRGFDERHLATTLHEADDDYRYSFAYALERLVAGLLMPNAQTTQFGEYINRYHESEKILPLSQVQMGDSAVIAVLCDIYHTIDRLRDVGTKVATAKNWLIAFENFIKEKFDVFMQTNALNSIWSALNAFDQNIQANQRYATTHLANTTTSTSIDPDKLPLKLGFILASIESELASQQVSAEPSGVITFGRIGAVRNLPYKLVVMLNLNLSTFPTRDKNNRYDLMQAGMSKRGDRFKEDDELGAFLDAILSAKEACWLFYNGASTSDSHEHLPASPVTELVDFLQGEIDWQITSQDQQHRFLQKNSTQLVQSWLVTKHPALPFASDYFNDLAEPKQPKNDSEKTQQHIALIKHTQKSLYPSAPVWQTVFEQLYQSAPNDSKGSQKIHLWQSNALYAWLDQWDKQRNKLYKHNSTTNFPLQADIPVHYADLSVIIRAVQQPAKTFIKSQAIHVTQYENDAQTSEPLELDALAKYQINASLLHQLLIPLATTDQKDTDSHTLNHLVFSNALPAGASRYVSIHTQRQKIYQDTLAFWEKLQHIDNKQFPAVAKVMATFMTQSNATAKKDNTPQEKISSQRLTDIITPCQEQRFAVMIADVALLKPTLKTDIKSDELWQSCIITANIPVLLTQVPKQTEDNTDKAEAIDTGYWINYLPTSGREKYQVQFWLSHLGWQVARQTTPEQVSQGHGFSLWQFSDKKTLYLPPIAYEQAYAWLQDWVMFWQWCQIHIAVLPPSVVLPVLKHIQEGLADDNNTQKGNAKPKTANTNNGKKNPDSADIATALAKTGWKDNAYHQSQIKYEDDPTHPIWAFLLKDKDLTTSIIPFIKTWGERLYTPIISHMQLLENLVTETTPIETLMTDSLTTKLTKSKVVSKKTKATSADVESDTPKKTTKTKPTPKK